MAIFRLRNRFDDPPIGVFERDARFSGGTFYISERTATLEEASRIAEGIRNGTTDPFLEKAWVRMEAFRPRRPDGKYEPGWVIQMEFVRPGPGEYLEGAPALVGVA